MSPKTVRVIPYVEDTKNCLILEPLERYSREVMATLQAAFKQAIQLEYQLEERELYAEPLPDYTNRKEILFFESSEGGAGVLRQLVDDRNAFGNLVRRALEVCHYDPNTGMDLGRSEFSREDCEAACYDCLLSYTNQQDHRLIDRKSIKTILYGLLNANVELSPVKESRANHMERLKRRCDSNLELTWLEFLDTHVLNLPTDAQKLIEEAHTRPDFLYSNHLLAIYIDGPPHDYPDRQERDKEQEITLFNLGYSVLRFHHADDWEGVVKRFPNVFGGM